MALKKRGMFFSLIGISLVIMLLLTFSQETEYSLRDSMAVTSIRIYSMDTFITDVEEDIYRGIYITSIRALIGMSEFMARNGSFVPDINSSFEEVFINGSLAGNEIEIMKNSTFINWSDKIKGVGQKLDILVDFDVEEVSIYQDSPWEVKVGLNVSMSFTDMKNTASWSRSIYTVSNFSIEGLEDPLYLIKTEGKLTNRIIRTPVEYFVDTSNNDTTNLQIHLNSSYYIASETAPSYLMRMEGNLSSSPYGIESLVNLDEIQAQGIVPKQRSAVDYIYFGGQTPTTYRINYMPLWFMLDEEHLEVYECEDLSY